MRRATVLALVAAVAAVAITACGTEPDSATGPAAPGRRAGQVPAASPGGDNVPRAPVATTAKPRPKVRDQPDCKAYARFSFANFGVAMASESSRESVISTFQKLAEAFKAEAPQFTEQIDRVVVLSTKSATDGLTEDEKEQYRDAFGGMQAWNEETCLIQPGTPEYDG